MVIEETPLKGVLILKPTVFKDNRGFFLESFNQKVFELATGLKNVNFVQDNHSQSEKGVLRGLHFQVKHCQSKLVRVTKGEIFDVVVDIVLKGTYNFSLAVGKQWIKNKQKGKMLNIVTTYAWTGSGYVVPSAAAKGGVLSLSRSLAAEWAKYDININAIAPGPFPTKGAWDRLFPKPFRAFVDPKKRIPLKRFGEHQELANLAAYLVSDYSDYMTGEVVTIDGGEWIYNAGEFSWLDKVPKKLWGLIDKVTRKK